MNKEPQNDEGCTWTFDISCSIFCGSEIVFTKYLVWREKPGFEGHLLIAKDNSTNTTNTMNKHRGFEGC